MIQTILDSQLWLMNNADPDHPRLTSIIGGLAARRYRRMEQRRAVREVIRQLEWMFERKILHLVEWARLKSWSRDPFTRMGYSYLPYGSRETGREELGASVDDTLFFAGEACAVGQPASVHGAYADGVRVANQVLAS
jgi:monoamine oxidase